MGFLKAFVLVCVFNVRMSSDLDKHNRCLHVARRPLLTASF